jgi:hypothetical protein
MKYRRCQENETRLCWQRVSGLTKESELVRILRELDSQKFSS